MAYKRVPMRAIWSCAAVLALSMGCSGPDVHFDYDVKAGYQAYKTYDWYAAPAAKAGGNAIMDTRVRRAVEAEMTARNFRKETAADPDFLLTYYASYEARRSRGPHMGVGIGISPFRGLGIGLGMGGPVGGRRIEKVGSIILEIQDFKTKTLVWRAVADQVLDDSATPEDSDEIVAQAVKKMLGRFPPTVKP